MRTVRVQIDGDAIEYEVAAETAFGADEVLLERDDDLLARTAFADSGFTVAPLLAAARYAELVEGVRRLLFAAVARVVPSLSDSSFTLDGYHRAVTDAEHMAVVEATGLHWPNDDLPIPMALVERRVSEILNTDVVAINPRFDLHHFQVRVVRPGRPDNNPPHRDVWLDRLRNAVNVYIPLAGSNASSSLPLVPGSHRWGEAEIERTVSGALVDGVRYTVPAVTGVRRGWRMVRPPVRPNELMLFTPYAIHGGGVNRNADLTRVSLEIRFWRRP